MARTENLQEIHDFAIQLGKDAGNFLLKSVKSRYGGPDNTHGQSQEFVEKANAVDLVTQVDEGKTLSYGVLQATPKTAHETNLETIWLCRGRKFN